MFSQFRSYDFLPRIAYYLFRNKKIKSNKVDIKIIPDVPAAIWWVDNFGNCKTTILSEELSLKTSNFIKTKSRKLKYYAKLKDVPNKSPAIIIGSSGLEQVRFLEIVIQGGNASKSFNLKSGDEIF